MTTQNSDALSYRSAIQTMVVRHQSLLWMAVAFCATIGIAVSAVAIFRAPHTHKSLGIALAASARVAFLFFWPAYVWKRVDFSFWRSFFGLKDASAQSWLGICGRPPRSSRVCSPSLRCWTSAARTSVCRVWHSGVFDLFPSAPINRWYAADDASRVVAVSPRRRHELHCVRVPNRFRKIPIKRSPRRRLIHPLRCAFDCWPTVKTGRVDAEAEPHKDRTGRLNFTASQVDSLATPATRQAARRCLGPT